MPVLPRPERGQPLDVDYIYELANAINSVSNTVAVKFSSTSQINQETDSTSSLKIYAATQQLNIKSPKADETTTFTFSYPTFKSTPVVTTTILNSDGSAAGNNIILTVKNVTPTQCTVTALFKKAGNLNVSVNLIAVGTSQ